MRMTQRSTVEAGWVVRGKLDDPDLAACSAAHESAYVRAAGKAPAKKAKK